MREQQVDTDVGSALQQFPNRAARRAKGKRSQTAPRNIGKVRQVRFDHATDPRQYAAHRRG